MKGATRLSPPGSAPPHTGKYYASYVVIAGGLETANQISERSLKYCSLVMPAVLRVTFDYKIRQVFFVLDHDRAGAAASLHGGVVTFSAGNSIPKF